jgi:hypothetical protein
MRLTLYNPQNYPHDSQSERKTDQPEQHRTHVHEPRGNSRFERTISISEGTEH